MTDLDPMGGPIIKIFLLPCSGLQFINFYFVSDKRREGEGKRIGVGTVYQTEPREFG